MPDLGACVARVIPGGSYGAFHAYACGNPGKVQGVDGKPYCLKHDPVKKAAADAERQKAYNAKMEVIRRQHELSDVKSEALELLDLIAECVREQDIPGSLMVYAIPNTIAGKAVELSERAKALKAAA